MFASNHYLRPQLPAPAPTPRRHHNQNIITSTATIIVVVAVVLNIMHAILAAEKPLRLAAAPSIRSACHDPSGLGDSSQESRRDRNRRIDMGDDSAKLKIVASGQVTTLVTSLT